MNCGICGGGGGSSYLKAGDHQLVKCSGCGLVYISNFRRIEPAYYERDYFTEINDYVRRWDDFCALFESIFDKMAPHKRCGRLLDIGTGVGILVDVASRRGFDAKGVEVSNWASAFARDRKGLDVLTGTLDDAKFDNKSFDVVVINHVLEHVDHPRAVLSEIHRILKGDGLLVVGVPNIASLMARLTGSRWPSLQPDAHLWHFSPETLKRLMDVSNFRVVFFEAKDNHPAIGWGPVGILRRIINAASVLSNRSEAMLLFAVKRESPG